MYPSTIVNRHYGAWAFDAVEAMLDRLSVTKHTIDATDYTHTITGSAETNFSNTSGAVWVFDTASTYNLPDTYWESDSNGNILFTGV